MFLILLNTIGGFEGLVVVVFIFVVLYFSVQWERLSAKSRREKSLAQIKAPDKTEPNDKLVLIAGATYQDTTVAIKGFCEAYNQREIVCVARLIALSDNGFAVTFPYNTSLENFGYFVNYVSLPPDVERPLNVTGWCSAVEGDKYIDREHINKPLMMYVSEKEEECMNVYLTYSDNQCYEINFDEHHEKLIMPLKRQYISPKEIDTDLPRNNEFEAYM